MLLGLMTKRGYLGCIWAYQLLRTIKLYGGQSIAECFDWSNSAINFLIKYFPKTQERLLYRQLPKADR